MIDLWSYQNNFSGLLKNFFIVFNKKISFKLFIYFFNRISKKNITLDNIT